jgi:predicted enzyme related to lactoylglutathione lyase
MTDVLTHDRGAFCMPELHTADVGAATRFYGELFGWRAAAVPASDGNYFLFQRGGRDVAGLRRVAAGPHRWVSHVLVDSIEDTIARAAQLGADTSRAPLDMPGIGRTCVMHDAQGAEFGLWEAGGHAGARLIDVTGSMWWMELMSPDAAAAREFYTALFGWTFTETDRFELPSPYTVFRIGEQSVAGISQTQPEWGVSPRWQVYFAVDDWTDTVKRACAMGGSLGFWRDVPTVGRLGDLRDPADGSFVVMEPNQMPAPS